MISTVALAAAVAIAAGGTASAFRATFVPGLVTQALGAGLLGAIGLVVLVDGTEAGSAFTSSFAPRLGLDPLTGTFLLALGAVGLPALVFATRYLSPTATGRAVAVLTGVFLLAMTLTLCARDPVSFLAGWELMSLAPAGAILLVRGATAEGRRAVFVYLALTHLAGAGAWLAVLLAAHEGAFDGRMERGSAAQLTVALAAIIGMGAKAGLMPLHSWLPRAHPIAPAHISALMSGVMVKIALYGLIRVLVDWCGPLPLWLGGLVLAVGLLSAVGGIVYALFQRELKRILAFSTVENVGIVVLAIGASLVLRARGSETWAAIALAAALLHVLTHAVAKGALFLGAGAFERAVGSLEIDSLGGLLRRMPIAGAAFLIGCASVAGLPPLGGFASEWLAAKALLRVPAEGGLGDGIIAALGLAGVAATAALAVFCFAKVVGLVLLGAPRRDACAHAEEPSRALGWPLAFLGATCVALGAAPGLLFGSLTTAGPWSGGEATRTAGLSLPDASRLPTGGIVVVLVGLTGVLLVARRSVPVTRATPTWACGQLVEPSLAWTSAGFTKPLRLVLETALRPRREVQVIRSRGVTQTVTYQGFVPHLFDLHLYRPAVRAATRAAAHARRLQSGRLSLYVGYLMGLVVLLLALAKWGLVG